MGSGIWAVLVVTPAGLGSRNMAAGNFLVVILLVGASEAARQLRGNAPRDERSLTNTFPFNAKDSDYGAGHHGDGDHGAGHHGHHKPAARQPFSEVTARDQRQRGGADVPVDFGAVAGASPGRDGKRCIDKVEMIEETEYDEVVQCDHSYDRRCHTTYVTQYESQQEEDCEENFRKICFIEYEQIAFNETAEICRTLLSRIVISRDLRSAGPSTSPSVGPSRRCTMWRTTSSSAPLRLRRSARMRPLDTPPTPSAPSGQGRFAACPRSK